MTKRRTILAVVLGLIIALCLSFAVACGGDKGGDKTMSSVTWNIDDKENVTVTLEDGTEQLPETFAVGEELKFKVTPKTGYEVTVKVGSRGQTLTAKDGVYTYAVTGNSTVITITVTRTLKSVEVSTKPTKMTYFAGEELDPAGMVVTAKYEVGNDETVTAYTINYPTEGAAYFALGDTSFTVTYGGKTSAAVALDATVVGKVTLDTQGGQIADGYKTFLEGKKAEYGIDNIAVDATTHAMTFTFASQLVKDIELPTAAMMTRGEGAAQSDYEFQAWNGGSAATAKVPAETAVSVEYKAVWKVHLLDLTKIYYNLDTTGSEKVPQLIVEGKFRAAKSAYLFLYEGNDQVELKGPTIPATGEANRGDDFKLTFDMREVVKKGYVGKWMDIKFVAESDGVKDTQEINVADYADVTDFYKDDDRVNLDGYRYYFTTYTYGGVTTLKAVAAEYVSMEYTIAAQENAGKLEFKFNGTVNEEIFYNKTAVIDFYVGSTKAYYGAIGADGKFEITVDTSDWPLTTIAYAHFSIIESQEDTTKLFPKSGEYNLVNNDCKTDFEDNGEKAPDGSNGNLLTNGTIMVCNADFTRVFYIGPGKWDGIIAYGYNENASLEVVGDVALKVDSMTEPTKVYYVVTVKVGGRVGYDEAKLKTIVFGNTDGGVVVYKQDTARFAAVEGEDRTFKLWFDVTAHAGKTMLWSNLYFENAPTAEGGDPTYDKILEIKDSDCSTNGLYAVVGGKKYTILCTTAANNDAEGEFKNNTYNSSNLVCTDAEATDTNPPENNPAYVAKFELVVNYATSKLELVSGKPMLTIKGTVEGFSASDIVFDLQADDNWSYIIFKDVATVDAQGNFTISVDLSSVATNAADKHYLMHIELKPVFDGNNYKKVDDKVVHDSHGKTMDLELDAAALTLFGKKDGDDLFTVSANQKTYTLGITGMWSRHMVTIVVVDDTEPKYTATGIVLEKTTDKLYITISGTSQNYTDADLTTALGAIRLTLQHNNNIDKQGWDYVTPETQTLTVTNGAWTLKVDVTGVAVGSYTCKLTTAKAGESAADGNSSNLSVTNVTEAAQELSGKKFIIVHAEGSSAGKRFWGGVGFEIIESTATKIETMSADLEIDNNKVYFVLTVRAPGSTADTFKTSKMGDGEANATVCSKVVASGNGVYFKLYFDVTDLSNTLWTHLYINGAGYPGSENGNIYADPDKKPVTLNGKTYDLQANDGTFWITQILVSSDGE